MDLQKTISELQEKNRETAHDTHKEEYDQVEFFHYNRAEIDGVTTDTAHSVALAVIREMIEREKGMLEILTEEDVWGKHAKQNTIDYLNTLEAKIKE